MRMPSPILRSRDALRCAERSTAPAGSPVPRRARVAIGVGLLLAACASPPSDATARAEIEDALARSTRATIDQDIDAYMELIPEDLVLHDESGEVLGRDRLRADVLRDWSIIPKTLSIDVTIDDLEVHGETATVYTSQRWERLMFQRDGKTMDTVLTTQKHKETWRRTPRGWLAYEIEELGGEVFVNGERYEPGR